MMMSRFSHWQLKEYKGERKLEFFKKKKQQSAAVQTAPVYPKAPHPFDIIENYSPLSGNEMELYRTLRDAVPVIDAAISKIIRLTGDFKIVCEDEEIEKEINKFISNVQVNSCGRGVHHFISSHLNQLLTYGTAIGEIVLSGDSESIAALYNASLSNVVLTTKDNPLNLVIYRKKPDGSMKAIKYPQLVLISTLNPEPGYIYGSSIMKGLPFVSGILLKIFKTIGANWERVGNVRFAVTYKPSSDAGERAYTKERASQIASEWTKAMKSQNPTDFIAIGDVGIKVIGADNQILESQIPVRQMLEQIVSKLSIPPFLLGLSWSSTETMSTQQAEILNSEIESYRRILNPIISKICDMWLRLNGFRCSYEISWCKIDLEDQLQIANTRLTNAKAREIEKRLEEK